MLAFVEPWPDVRHSLRDQPRQRETFPTERDRVSLSHSPFISRQAEIGPDSAVPLRAQFLPFEVFPHAPKTGRLPCTLGKRATWVGSERESECKRAPVHYPARLRSIRPIADVYCKSQWRVRSAL